METAVSTKLDLRGLEPPEPMMRVLEYLATSSPGTAFSIRLDRRPMFLLEELSRRGQVCQCVENPDGGWLLEFVANRVP